MDLGCLDCDESICAGQIRTQTSIIFLGSEDLELLRRFLYTHRGHALKFEEDQFLDCSVEFRVEGDSIVRVDRVNDDVDRVIGSISDGNTTLK